MEEVEVEATTVVVWRRVEDLVVVAGT